MPTAAQPPTGKGSERTRCKLISLRLRSVEPSSFGAATYVVTSRPSAGNRRNMRARPKNATSAIVAPVAVRRSMPVMAPSLVAFIVAALSLAYRTRLTNRAEIIKSAPEKERLEAIATTAEFFRVDVSGLTRAQQQDIALTQIHARARRDLLLAGVSLTIAVLLAAIAIVAILASKSPGTAIVVNPSGPVIAAGRDIIGPLTIGPDQVKLGERVRQAPKPLSAK